jgi:hypothetical protein
MKTSRAHPFRSTAVGNLISHGGKKGTLHLSCLTSDPDMLTLRNCKTRLRWPARSKLTRVRSGLSHDTFNKTIRVHVRSKDWLQDYTYYAALNGQGPTWQERTLMKGNTWMQGRQGGSALLRWHDVCGDRAAIGAISGAAAKFWCVFAAFASGQRRGGCFVSTTARANVKWSHELAESKTFNVWCCQCAIKYEKVFWVWRNEIAKIFQLALAFLGCHGHWVHVES